MIKVLDNDQTTGKVIHFRTGNPNDVGPRFIVGVQSIILTGHAGGTWTLQCQAPNGTWVDSNVTFDDNGIKDFYGWPEVDYRLNGGDVGAEAWATGVSSAE